jgi:pyruvate/2-oxoglutarate dehydrogenase complex dihydrolipoamide dehydrogenase (E3) component
MTIKTNMKVTKIESNKTVEAEIDGRKEKFSTDQVLLATGRPSNVGSLKPERANIALDQGAVKVSPIGQLNPRLRSGRRRRKASTLAGCVV